MLLRHLLFHITMALLIVPAALPAQQAPATGPLYVAVATPTIGQAARLNVASVAALALASNPSASAARQRLLEAQARFGEASAQFGLQPTFSASTGGTAGHVAGSTAAEIASYTVQGLLNIPIPNGRRLSGLRAQSNAQLRAAQAGLDRARLDLTFRASDSYYGVLRARGARDIAQENLTQAERQVQDIQKRVDAGDLAIADVIKAQVPVAQSRVALARAQNAVRVSEQTLNSLIQHDLAAPLDLAPLTDLPPLNLTLEQVVAQAFDRSPDVREAQANLDAAQAAIQAGRHAHDPDYAVQASYLLTNDPTAYSNLSTVTFTVSFPLGVGGIQKQQMKQVQAQLEQAKAALTLAKQQAQLAAEQAYLDVKGDEANVTATQETVRIAQDSLDKTRLAFTAGLTTTRDVLDAQLALAQTRNEANSAKYDLAVARAKLDQVIAADRKP